MITEKMALPAGHVIAVGSGKGGVGKSTVSANLAAALAREGYKVGLLDGDVYGPNIPMMFGVQDAVAMHSEETVTPVSAAGVDLVSLGLLVNAHDAMLWRGPMVHKFVQQLLGMTKWNEMDYLIVDLPPGTGDVQLSLAQLTGVSGSIVVTTPQPVAVADAKRGISAFRKLEVPVLGVIENMSGEIFGQGGGETAAFDMEVPWLGSIPLDPAVRQAADAGKVIAASDSDHPVSRIYFDLAGKLTERLPL